MLSGTGKTFVDFPGDTVPCCQCPDSTVHIINDHFSLNVIWAGLITCMEERKNLYKTLAGKCEKKSHLGALGLNGKIILKWTLKKTVFH